MQFPLSLIALLLLAAITTVFSAEKRCQQCATPNLKVNWAATGFPIRPTTLTYSDKCASPDATDKADETLLSKSCASSCFELLVPIDGNYGILRGCHEYFVYADMIVTANASWSCEQNVVPDYGKVQLFAKDTVEDTAYDALAFCPATETEPCNDVISSTSISKDGITTCQNGLAKTCKACSVYDGDGSCSASTSGTCKGAYCTKTVGKMNGHYYEARGCSGFNPFARELCSWSEQLLNVTTAVRALALPGRSKRSVSMLFQATQCFCAGELCNSSPRSLLSTSIAFLLSFTFIRLF